MTDIKNEDTGDKKSLNFIEQAVEKDLKEGKNGGKVQTRTDTFTSVMPKLFALTSASLPSMAAYVTFVSTTQIRPKRMWNM